MMIGPSSGTSNVPNREASESSVRVKRKVFDDLDIESFCEEVCQSGKKRYLTELQASAEGDTTMNSNFLALSGQEASTAGSVARLEVLVVDGTWDTTNLENYGTIPYWESPGDISTSGVPATPGNTATNVLVPPSMPVEDQENGNLSWLLDFKLDSFIEAPEEKSCEPGPRESPSGNRNRFHSQSRVNGSVSYTNEMKRPYNHDGPGTSSLHQNLSNGYTVTDNRNISASRYNGPKKPPFTYTELIEHALQERGELTVSAIYQWISEHFPYYKSNDDRWKNSVRHNLSINPHFRKGSKAPHGAGHLWAIANRGDSRPRQITPGISSGATARQIVKNVQDSVYRKNANNASQIISMDEVAAATASIQQPEDTNSIVNSVTLEHCAEQILSGIKREVEVQYLVPMAVPNNGEHQDPGQESQQSCQTVKETDFLNPVSKEVVAEECGLIGEGYLVTDLNPTALGLNMVEPEIISPENLFGEELSFQFYELTSPSQLQSA
ncbi:uncharacterized protein LOC107268074 isoform X2 [Cephus cinctus]|uniref:Uncharacterized protein LOC107268074 isoform X2 n=1 Tax=Cephus cinctus TaxID=211228 RepID=A0AAJ7W1P0_CEPCN|nr:uncharacterized protein LOC107268074 isoform X2 [Cephus cinctus]